MKKKSRNVNKNSSGKFFWGSILGIVLSIGVIVGVVLGVPAIQTKLADTFIEQSTIHQLTLEENEELKSLNQENENTISQLNSLITSKNTTISLLTTNLETAISEREVLLEQYNSLILEKNRLNETISQKNTIIQNYENNISLLQSQVSTLELEKTNLQNQLNESNSNIDNLNDIISQKESEIESLESDIEELNSLIEDMQSDIDVLQLSLDEALDKIDYLYGQIYDLENDIDELEDDLTESINEKNNLLNQVNEKQNEIDRLNNSITLLTTSYNELEDDYNEALDLLTIKQNQITSLEGQITELNGDIATLQSQLTDSQNENNNLLLQIAEKESEITSLNEELDDLRNDYTLLQSTCDDLNSELQEINNLLNEANNKIEELNNDKISLQSLLDEANDKCDTLFNQLTLKESELDALTTELDSLQDDYDMLLLEKESLLNDYQDCLDTISLYEEQIDTLSTEKDNLQNQLNSAFEENEQLTNQVIEKNNQISLLNTEISSLQSQIDLISEQKTELENQLANAQQSIEELNEQIGLKEDEIEELNETITSLTTQVESMQSELASYEQYTILIDRTNPIGSIVVHDEKLNANATLTNVNIDSLNLYSWQTATITYNDDAVNTGIVKGILNGVVQPTCSVDVSGEIGDTFNVNSQVNDIFLKVTETDGNVLTFKCSKRLSNDFYSYKTDNALTVEVPEGVTILGNNSLTRFSNMKNLVLPSTLRQLETAIFSPKNLETISISSNNQNFRVNNNCLLSKDGMKLYFGTKNSVIPTYVSSIEGYAFYRSGIESISIPGSVKEIKACAFEESNLRDVVLCNGVEKIYPNTFSNLNNANSISIPASCNSIGNQAMLYSEFQTITIDSKNPFYSSTGNCILSKDESILYVGNKYSVMPTTVVEIADNAFWGSSISEITLHEGIKKIGNSAFYDTKINYIEFPESLEYLGSGCLGNGVQSFVAIFKSENVPAIQGMLSSPKSNKIYDKIFIPAGKLEEYKTNSTIKSYYNYYPNSLFEKPSEQIDLVHTRYISNARALDLFDDEKCIYRDGYGHNYETTYEYIPEYNLVKIKYVDGTDIAHAYFKDENTLLIGLTEYQYYETEEIVLNSADGLNQTIDLCGVKDKVYHITKTEDVEFNITIKVDCDTDVKSVVIEDIGKASIKYNGLSNSTSDKVYSLISNNWVDRTHTIKYFNCDGGISKNIYMYNI